MFAWLFACTAGPALQGMPTGEWVIEGDRYSGSLRVEERACSIELWGPTIQAGPGEVACESVREEAGYGVFFALEMGAGKASAYAQVDSGLTAFTLPLGSRQGDFEQRLRLVPGELAPSRREEARLGAARGLEESRAMWEQSVFQLRDDEDLVGELFFPSDGAPEIQLYSASSMTRGRVKTSLLEKGPDLWLSFEIMPSLKAEEGLVLVNRAENRLVFPMGETPLPGEISLELRGGPVSEVDRDQRVEAALEQGLSQERALTEPAVGALWAHLQNEGCRPWSEVAAEVVDLRLVLQGYAVEIQEETEGCRLLVEPRPVQQGRRLAFRVQSGEEIEVVERRFLPGVPKNF